MKAILRAVRNSSDGLCALVAIAFCVCLPSGVLAAPAITGVGGTVSNGQTITISGTGFGSSGPTIAIFDDFEKGTSGIPVSTSAGSAQINQWSRVQGDVRYSNSYGHSGIKSGTVDFNRRGGDLGQVYLYFNNSTQVYLSLWLYLPVGKDVPGTNNPDGPNWKLFWLWSDPWPNSDFLPVFLTNQLPMPDGYANWGAADDINPPARYQGAWWTSTFKRGEWKRWDLYMKGGQSDGAAQFRELTNSGFMTISDASAVYTMHPGEYWNRLTVPGYGRDDTNSVVYFDDIYFATGAGARARVEIGNKSSYMSCTNLAIITPSAWSNTSITATFRQGSFTAGAAAYIFVVDSTGVASPGYPVTIGSGGNDPSPAPSTVSAPTGLKVITN